MAVTPKHPHPFARRHIGPSARDIEQMLEVVGASSLDELIEQTVPADIRLGRELDLPRPRAEHEMLAELRKIADKNVVYKSFIGMGYSDTITPEVILRNIVQNPGWYTQYTPYQAEISQGRLEALLNFQTMVMDLTGLEVANASLLDEATAAAEAMNLALGTAGNEERNAFFVSEQCHPQTIAVVRTRAEALGVKLVVGDHRTYDFADKPFGVLVQYPGTDGRIDDFRAFFERAHAEGALAIVAADILSLALLTPPGELGADVAIGNTQRFGVPLGYGGPHAAYFACKQAHVRRMPGRIIGVSEDANGKPALRMALQTREQHIRRERATSNICTAQALLAIVASMYAVYHGPEGIRAIAERVHGLATILATGLRKLGVKVVHEHFFDTIRVEAESAEIEAYYQAAQARRINLRRIDERSLGIALDEATEFADIDTLFAVFANGKEVSFTASQLAEEAKPALPEALVRTSPYLTHPIFRRYRSETEMLRYMRKLESRDLSLAHSMIPLGSCTMKLNATAEMVPITWPEFSKLHPFCPPEQARGYAELFEQLEAALAEVTGFAAISLQPNAGSQGEYAGLLVIRKYHQSRGEGHRNVCLIPSSAHGTNPASAVMAGFRVVVVACDERGNIDVADLERKAKEHKDNLAALMVTYPSTHGVFEAEIKKICRIVHENGGQVYMDGANMNAQVGLCRPGDIGADVCHLNLHKTFCIPHGGGGPGMGPIGVASHLVKFLPGHPVVKLGGEEAIGPVSAAPYGSPSILPISWAYIRMMGAAGLTEATKVAILNANYIAKRLEPYFPVVYVGDKGRVAHECIIDVRQFKRTAGIEVDDIAKRLMDYGFHAPTMSFPIPGTLMIEPTESESKEELDRFCDAMIAIRKEIDEVVEGVQPKGNNVLTHAPHTAEVLTRDTWDRPYSRERAAFPLPYVRERKFWPYVGRLNNALGDRKLVCACPPIEDYMS